MHANIDFLNLMNNSLFALLNKTEKSKVVGIRLEAKVKSNSKATIAVVRFSPLPLKHESTVYEQVGLHFILVLAFIFKKINK